VDVFYFFAAGRKNGDVFDFRLGGFGEATSFGSAYFTERTGHQRVFGGGGGFEIAITTRLAAMGFDVYAGANRPEALARMSELATRLEMRGQFYGRFGW
jgi:hypothetical protein